MNNHNNAQRARASATDEKRSSTTRRSVSSSVRASTKASFMICRRLIGVSLSIHLVITSFCKAKDRARTSTSYVSNENKR